MLVMSQNANDTEVEKTCVTASAKTITVVLPAGTLPRAVG